MSTPQNARWAQLKKTFQWVVALNVPVYASHAGFFIALSVFPTLVLLMSLLRYTNLGAETLTELLHGIVPTALMPAAQKLILNTYRSSTGTVLSVSAVTALWSASRGIHGLRTGLNRIYGVREDRGYFHTRLLSVVYTFAFLLVLVLTLVLHVFGTTLLRWLPLEQSGLFALLENVVDLRFFLLLGLQTGLFCAMFTVLPNRKQRLADAFPGAVFASIGWLVFSHLYSVYVEHFASLSVVYGSVYAVALSLLWLYCCISIVFYGGALNRWLQFDREQTD